MSPSARAASCLLSAPVTKGASIDASFQHSSLSSSGFFVLHWNSSGDSALTATEVPFILAALDSARACYQQLPGAWEIPLGPRTAYPVLAVRQSMPGATTLPFAEDGVSGLTWIQLDCDFTRWGGDAALLRDATCAHEVFHALQFARGADLRDRAFYEASAVWAEDHCFPAHDDWAWRYLPALLENLHQAWDATDGLREYGAGAIIKHMLNGDWSPCREALLLADDSRRCWPLLLDQWEDPAALMATCLAELLQAGSHELLPWRVPELALAPAVPRAATLAIRPGLALPSEALTLDALCWRALPVEASGTFRADCGDQMPHITQGIGAAPLPCDSSVQVFQGQWLLLVNTTETEAEGLRDLEWMEDKALHIWPNPGGRERRVRFDDQARPLEICNLLGQRLALWFPPTEGRGPHRLELPPAATGTLLVHEWPQGKGLAITVR